MYTYIKVIATRYLVSFLSINNVIIACSVCVQSYMIQFTVIYPLLPFTMCLIKLNYRRKRRKDVRDEDQILLIKFKTSLKLLSHHVSLPLEEYIYIWSSTHSSNGTQNFTQKKTRKLLIHWSRQRHRGGNKMRNASVHGWTRSKLLLLEVIIENRKFGIQLTHSLFLTHNFPFKWIISRFEFESYSNLFTVSTSAVPFPLLILPHWMHSFA